MQEVSKHHDLYILCFSQKSHQPNTEDRHKALDGLAQIGDVIGLFTLESDQSKFSKFALAARSLLTRDPYTVNWLKKPSVAEVIRKAVCIHSIELVHFDTIGWAAYLEDTVGCKRVLNHHNIESHMMLRRARQEKNIFKKQYYSQEGLRLKAYEKRVCGLFDLNITCSVKDTERLLLDSPSLQVEEIPNGVDVSYFYSQGMQHESNSMIFAGGLSWYPNIAAMEFFVREVWPGLVNEVPNAKMTLIGRNPPKWLKEFAESNNNFQVTGFVDDVRPYLDRAAVYVCPIADGGGTKLKILDALAMEKAIVAHPVACEGIDVINGKHVIFAETPADYIKSIKMLLDDCELRRFLGKNGRELIETTYDFVRIGEKLSLLYNKL